MIVMVLYVIPVVVIVVVEIVVLARAVLDVVLTDVIPHVIIGVSVYVKIAVLLNRHHVELLLVRLQAENESKNKQSLTR